MRLGCRLSVRARPAIAMDASSASTYFINYPIASKRLFSSSPELPLVGVSVPTSTHHDSPGNSDSEQVAAALNTATSKDTSKDSKDGQDGHAANTLSETSQQIQLAHQQGKSIKVLTLAREARQNGTPLAAADCVVALSCAAKLAEGKNLNPAVLTYSDNFSPPSVSSGSGGKGKGSSIQAKAASKWGSLMDIYELSIDMLTALNALKVCSRDAYFAAMKVCAEAKIPRSALNIMTEIKTLTKLASDDSIQAEYVKALCSAADLSTRVHDRETRMFFILEGIKGYEKLRAFRQDKGIKAADASVYISAAGAYSYLLGPIGPRTAPTRLVNVLQDMMEDGFEPRVALCRGILGSAVKFQESELMHIMLEWFLIHFEYPVEEGVLTAIMSYAQRSSDLGLARLAIKCREKSFMIRRRIAASAGQGQGQGQGSGSKGSKGSKKAAGADAMLCDTLGSNGVSIWDYATALMIAVHNKSSITAIEVLTEAGAMGLDLLSVPLGITAWEELTKICRRLRELDSVYFGLVRYIRYI
jgi:hypothetical protein